MIQLRLPGSRFNGSELMGYAAAIINFYVRETILKIYKSNAVFKKCFFFIRKIHKKVKKIFVLDPLVRQKKGNSW